MVKILVVNDDSRVLRKAIELSKSKSAVEAQPEPLNDLLSASNFIICQFGASKHDDCEVCGKDEIQLYYRRTCYESDEGEYYCIDCVRSEHEQNLKDLEGWADYAEKVSR